LSFVEPSLEVFLTFKPFRYTSTLDHEVYVQESRIELEPSRSTLSVGAPPVDGVDVVVERVTVSVAVAAFPAASSAVIEITFVPD
jgi:hypothetical protein